MWQVSKLIIAKLSEIIDTGANCCTESVANRIRVKDCKEECSTIPLCPISVSYRFQQTSISCSAPGRLPVVEVQSILRCIFPFSQRCLVTTVPFLFENGSQPLWQNISDYMTNSEVVELFSSVDWAGHRFFVATFF